MTTRNIEKHDKDLLDDGTVTVLLGDGWKRLTSRVPFDAIHVGAAAYSFPKELMVQLKEGGVLIVPVGPDGGAQTLYCIEKKLKDRSDFHKEDFRFSKLLGVRYVPLLHGRSSEEEKSSPGRGSNAQDFRVSSKISQGTWEDANLVDVNEARAEQRDGATEEYSDLSESGDESEAEARVNDESSECGSSMEGTS